MKELTNEEFFSIVHTLAHYDWEGQKFNIGLGVVDNIRGMLTGVPFQAEHSKDTQFDSMTMAIMIDPSQLPRSQLITACAEYFNIAIDAFSNGEASTLMRNLVMAHHDIEERQLTSYKHVRRIMWMFYRNVQRLGYTLWVIGEIDGVQSEWTVPTLDDAVLIKMDSSLKCLDD